jgi:hypothetical protein
MTLGYPAMSDESLAAPGPTPAITTLATLSGPDGRMAGEMYALGPDTAGKYGLRDARGWEQPVIERHQRLWAALGGQGYQQTLIDPPASRVPKLLDILGVRAVLLDYYHANDVRAGQTNPRYPVVYRGPDGVVERNPTALPRAFVAYAWRPSESLDQSLALVAAGSSADAQRRPVIEGSNAPPQGAPPPASPATVREPSDTDLTVTFDARAPGQLVLHDTYYPGWKAELDGREVPIRPANAAFRAVAVPAGRHQVRFVYRPASVYVGLYLSLAALLVLIGIVIAALVRSRGRLREAPVHRSPPGGAHGHDLL